MDTPETKKELGSDALFDKVGYLSETMLPVFDDDDKRRIEERKMEAYQGDGDG